MGVIKPYLSKVKISFKQRGQYPQPSVGLIILAVLIFNSFCILLSIIWVPEGKTIAYNIGGEGGFVTSISASYLILSSAFSLAILIVLKEIEHSVTLSWAILSFGFVYLAIDELMMIHENTGYIIERYFPIQYFRNWNDVIVIIYGLIALLIIAFILPAIIRFKWIIEMFYIGFLLYGIHTITDTINEPSTDFSIIIEESAKLFSVSFLFLGTFIGFIGSLKLMTSRKQETRLVYEPES